MFDMLGQSLVDALLLAGEPGATCLVLLHGLLEPLAASPAVDATRSGSSIALDASALRATFLVTVAVKVALVDPQSSQLSRPYRFGSRPLLGGRAVELHAGSCSWPPLSWGGGSALALRPRVAIDLLPGVG